VVYVARASFTPSGARGLGHVGPSRPLLDVAVAVVVVIVADHIHAAGVVAPAAGPSVIVAVAAEQPVGEGGDAGVVVHAVGAGRRRDARGDFAEAVTVVIATIRGEIPALTAVGATLEDAGVSLHVHDDAAGAARAEEVLRAVCVHAARRRGLDGLAGVADAIAVRVGLIGVRELRAVVAHVADVVAVRVELVGVGGQRAIVLPVGGAVAVRVRDLAGVADAVGVGVELVGVGDQRAVVPHVGDAVAVVVATLDADVTLQVADLERRAIRVVVAGRADRAALGADADRLPDGPAALDLDVDAEIAAGLLDAAEVPHLTVVLLAVLERARVADAILTRPVDALPGLLIPVHAARAVSDVGHLARTVLTAGTDLAGIGGGAVDLPAADPTEAGIAPGARVVVVARDGVQRGRVVHAAHLLVARIRGARVVVVAHRCDAGDATRLVVGTLRGGRAGLRAVAEQPVVAARRLVDVDDAVVVLVADVLGA